VYPLGAYVGKHPVEECIHASTGCFSHRFSVKAFGKLSMDIVSKKLPLYADHGVACNRCFWFNCPWKILWCRQYDLCSATTTKGKMDVLYKNTTFGIISLCLQWTLPSLPALTGQTRQFEQCSNSRVQPVVGQALSNQSESQQSVRPVPADPV
jgi:hypothetical protein